MWCFQHYSSLFSVAMNPAKFTDELGLFYIIQPEHIMVFTGDSCVGGNKSKQHVTVSLCWNAEGSHKPKPILIGKSAKPHCLKNVAVIPSSDQPLKPQSMDYVRDLLANFLASFNHGMVFTKHKVVLILENYTTNPKVIPRLTNVKLIFLPPSSTSKLEPMDADIIKNVKFYYLRQWVQCRLAAIDSIWSIIRYPILGSNSFCC